MCDAFFSISPPSLLIPSKLQISSSSNLSIKPPIRSKRPSVNAYANQNHSKRWSLQGFTALVTGGTRGIGRAIVEELATHGANVHTCARNESELNSCLKGWLDEGFEITGSVCDVSSRVAREKLMDDVSCLFGGKLYILVNNVGTNIRKPMVELTAKEYSHLISTNFESVFHISQLAHPFLKASGSGSIVFTSSVSAFVSLKSMALQGATKGAIYQLTKNLACEWAKDGIRSNAVAPWYIKTSMVEQVLSNKEYVEEVLDCTPLGPWGSKRGRITRCISLHASFIIHYWADHMRRWWHVSTRFLPETWVGFFLAIMFFFLW